MVVTLHLGHHLPWVEPGCTHHLLLFGGGDLMEEVEVVTHAHHWLCCKGELGQQVLDLVLVGLIREDLLDNLRDLLLGPKQTLPCLLFHLVFYLIELCENVSQKA